MGEVDSQEMTRIVAPVDAYVGMEPYVNDSGAFLLIWEYPDAQPLPVVVERADNDAFDNAAVLYRGGDDRTYVSGLPAGRHYFRVRLAGEFDSVFKDIPAPLVVDIAYQPLARVFTLMMLGALTFLATVVIIVGGTMCFKRQREREDARG